MEIRENIFKKKHFKSVGLILNNSNNKTTAATIENTRLKEWLECIHAISYDHDGETTVDGLKKLIDELHEMSVNALKNEPSPFEE